MTPRAESRLPLVGGSPTAFGPALASAGAPPGGSGALLYTYFDAKQVLLAHFLEIGGEALSRRIDQQAYDVAELAFGARATNDNATPGNPSDSVRSRSVIRLSGSGRYTLRRVLSRARTRRALAPE